METTGARIKRLRLARGFDQKTLATLAEMSPTTISRYETGASMPRTDDLARVARALGTSTGELTGSTDEILMQRFDAITDDPETTITLLEVVHGIEGAAEEHRDFVHGAFRALAASFSGMKRSAAC